MPNGASADDPPSVAAGVRRPTRRSTVGARRGTTPSSTLPTRPTGRSLVGEHAVRNPGPRPHRHELAAQARQRRPVDGPGVERLAVVRARGPACGSGPRGRCRRTRGRPTSRVHLAVGGREAGLEREPVRSPRTGESGSAESWRTWTASPPCAPRGDATRPRRLASGCSATPTRPRRTPSGGRRAGGRATSTRASRPPGTRERAARRGRPAARVPRLPLRIEVLGRHAGRTARRGRWAAGQYPAGRRSRRRTSRSHRERRPVALAGQRPDGRPEVPRRTRRGSTAPTRAAIVRWSRSDPSRGSFTAGRWTAGRWVLRPHDAVR